MKEKVYLVCGDSRHPLDASPLGERAIIEKLINTGVIKLCGN